jgi:5-methylcytosine-specific restriction endonuclease McrA
MHEERVLTTIPDDELLHRLAELLRDSRCTEADLVAHIGEVDRRRLYARSASPSMFRYCMHVLHLSEPEAYLRIVAARAARKHPVLLAMLADGRLHLSGIAKLAPHLTRENRDALLGRATHLSKRQIEELIAEICPRPDVPSLVRKLPGGVGQEPLLPARHPARGEGRAAASVVELSEARGRVRADGAPADPIELDLAGVSASRQSAGGVPPLALAGAETSSEPELRPGGVGASRCVVEPLAPSRYKVQFTASAELKDKLERLQALLRSEVPDGDLGAVIERAVTDNLERLEARRFAKTRAAARASTVAQPSKAHTFTIAQATTAIRPAIETQTQVQTQMQTQARTQAQTQITTASATRPRSSTLPPTGARGHVRHIPAAIRRAVHHRDEGRCRYVDETGRRCPERHRLEFHHIHPFGMGGGHTPENLRLMCRTHNFYLAEHDYGPKPMAIYRTG